MSDMLWWRHGEPTFLEMFTSSLKDGSSDATIQMLCLLSLQVEPNRIEVSTVLRNWQQLHRFSYESFARERLLDIPEGTFLLRECEQYFIEIDSPELEMTWKKEVKNAYMDFFTAHHADMAVCCMALLYIRCLCEETYNALVQSHLNYGMIRFAIALNDPCQ